MIEFTVYGVAQPQGSTRAFYVEKLKRAVVTSTNKKNKPWRALVADGASRALQELEQPIMFGGPVRLRIGFYLPRPKSLKRSETMHQKAPDLDKLVRSVGDALTGVLWNDDKQVVDLRAVKRYTAIGVPPHAVIAVDAVREG